MFHGIVPLFRAVPRMQYEGFPISWFLLVLAVLVSGLCIVEAMLPTPAYAHELPEGSVRVSRRFLVSEPIRIQPPAEIFPMLLGTIDVGDDGFVVSKNPVWNACIRGGYVLPGFIRMNPDRFLHRQGRVRKEIPLTCRDYRRGNPNVWRHPDFLSAEIFTRADGRFLGVLTEGFLVRESS